MVEVIYYERVNKNKVIGYADIRVPILKPTVMIFRKIAHLQNENKRWFNFPNFSRHGEGEKPKYIKYCEFETQSHNFQLMECMGEKIKEFCAQNGIEEVQPMDFNQAPEEEIMDHIPF